MLKAFCQLQRYLKTLFLCFVHSTKDFNFSPATF
jgi:hypothetical protein